MGVAQYCLPGYAGSYGNGVLWAPPYTREIDIFDGNKTKIDIVVNRLCAEYNREHALKFGSAADGVRRKFVLQHFFFKIFEKSAAVDNLKGLREASRRLM